MKEINLGRILIENRHKRGITQEELASYLGVSKAAVSKWETETTYLLSRKLNDALSSRLFYAHFDSHRDISHFKSSCFCELFF